MWPMAPLLLGLSSFLCQCPFRVGFKSTRFFVVVGDFQELPKLFPFFVKERAKGTCFLVQARTVSLLLIKLGMSSLNLWNNSLDYFHLPLG